MAVGPHVLEAAGLRGPGRQSRLREWWEQEHVFGYGLIVPAVVLLVTLVAFPFGMAIYFSLSDYWVGSPGAFVGLTNYRDILGNETFRQTVQNSFVFTGIALSLKVVLGAWLAMLLARALDAGVAVDVRLTLQRRQLDRHTAAPDQRAGAELARAVNVRHGRRHRRQCLAGSALFRHHRAGGADGRAPRGPRGLRGRRRELVGAFLAREAAT